MSYESRHRYTDLSAKERKRRREADAVLKAEIEGREPLSRRGAALLDVAVFDDDTYLPLWESEEEE